MTANSSPTKATVYDFSTVDLLEWYNAHSGEERVKRFADRTTAERRVIALIERLAGKAPTPAAPKTPAKAPRAARAPKAQRVLLTPEQRSAAVKASWANKATHTARRQRHNVRADGVLHESTRQAFIALKLDLKKHQQVRRDLVANGKVTHEGHKFLLVPKED